MDSTKKKWLTVLRTEQYLWIKEKAREYGIKGSDILGEALDRVMTDRDFIDRLAETKLKVKLQELNDAALEIEQQREAIRKQYKEVTGRERIRV